MSQLCKHQCNMIDTIKEIEKITKKVKKKKNQYTLSFKFDKAYDKELIQKLYLINSILPMELCINNPFRLKSDLQLAQKRSSEQLGELFVDIFSANYRVCSVQSSRSMILLNLEPYHLEEVNFDEVEKYYENVNQKYCQSLSKFQNIQEQSLNPNFIRKQVQPLSELEKLEVYTNNYPLSGYISKVKDGRRYTISKFLNILMLAYMGITYEMLKDYVCETKNIPYDIYCGEIFYDQIGEIYNIPSKQKDDQSYLEHQNYSGTRLYPKKATFQKLILEEESKDSYLEYYFYWIEDFQKDINLEQTEINQSDYFNTKKQKHDNYQIFDEEIIQEIEDAKLRMRNRCGVRTIKRNTI